jgi:hypothetical protein
MTQVIKLLIADDNEQLRNSLKGFFDVSGDITKVAKWLRSIDLE